MIAMDRPSRDVSRARGPQLRQAGDEALPFAELHAAGITSPAAVVSELEPNGYVMQRVCEHDRLVGVRLPAPEPPVTSSAPRWRRSHRCQPQYISRSPRIAPARVSVSAASIVVALSGAVRLAGLRSRAYRCSRGHRPSGCDTEARGRRATLPQRHRRGVGGSLTRTPLRHAYRLQRPCSSSDRSWLLWERVASVGLHHFARVRKLAQRRADSARLDAGFVCDLRGRLGAAV